MATDPIFFSTPNNGAVLLGAAETSLTAPTTTGIIYTPGAGKTAKVEEVVVTAIGTTVGGFAYIFRHDGAAYWIHDVLIVPAVTVSPGVTPPWRGVGRYPNLILKAGHSLRASQSIAGNANLLVAQAYGADE